MLLPQPRTVHLNPAYEPLARLLDDVLVTSAVLAQRWRLTEDHLSNWRRAQKGPAFIKLPSGSVRYRLSDVVAWELGGYQGSLSPDRVELALSTFKELSPELRARIVARIFEPIANEQK